MVVEVEESPVEGREGVAVGSGFGEAVFGNPDEEVVAFRGGCPKPSIEHPMSVRRESEAVAMIVVAAFSVLMDVGSLDDEGG